MRKKSLLLDARGSESIQQILLILLLTVSQVTPFRLNSNRFPCQLIKFESRQKLCLISINNAANTAEYLHGLRTRHTFALSITGIAEFVN